jgi:vesicle-associated membrane protein 7
MESERNRIIYTAIVDHGIIVAEYPKSEKEMANLVREIVPKLSETSAPKRTFQHVNCDFHYSRTTDSHVLICATPPNSSVSGSHQFLDSLWKQIEASGSKSLVPLLKRKMEEWEGGKEERIRKDIDEVTSLVTENVESILQRGEKLDVLEEKSEQLSEKSHLFQKQGRSLKREMWWKNAKLWIVFIIIGLFVAFCLSLIICGGFSFEKCKK